MIWVILPAYVQDLENNDIQREMLGSFTLFDQPGNPLTHHKKIAIDNGSLPTASIDLEQWADYYVITDHPIGYARAVNLGWAMVDQLASDDDFVLVLNNDLTFTEGWLTSLVSFLEQHPDAAAVAAEDRGVPHDAVSNHVWSSCFLMRQRTRKAIGFFDADQLPYRYHDQDYWMRAMSKGYQFYRIGASKVGHKESTTYKKMPERATEETERQIVEKRWGTYMAQWYQPMSQ